LDKFGRQVKLWDAVIFYARQQLVGQVWHAFSLLFSND
jgi:hypothetical protein